VNSTYFYKCAGKKIYNAFLHFSRKCTLTEFSITVNIGKEEIIKLGMYLMISLKKNNLKLENYYTLALGQITF
jgi:hypothetical protein